jgi:hypothetical protein
MFGPGVAEAIEARTHADRELFAVLKLFGTTTRTIERYALDRGIVRGFARSREQVVEVPLEEPFYERPFHDRAAEAYRFNEP